MWILALGCTPEPSQEAPRVVDWSRQRAPLDGESSAGRLWKRGIIHLHSPYSHDACDNHEGELTDEQCGQDLRDGLCADAEDYAFLTDHPSMAAEHTYEELLRLEGEDEVVDGVANSMACPDGRRVLIMPGIEDELMPIGLDEQAAATAEENDAIYNGTDATTFDAEIAAGASVFQAHTEGKTIEDLLARQQMGLSGVEVFNLHAMVDPTKREEDLGLDPTSYLADISPFITGTTDAEPDLAFLAFFQEQTVSLERWDALNQVAFTAATAGTDAHENALPSLLSDDERVDSYRRMMCWFSNVLLVDDDSPAAHQEAVVAGHSFVAFEAMGTPAGFDVRYGELDMGGEAAVGETLSVTCPTLAETTPQDGNAPDIEATVYKDGAVWQTGCGDWPVDEPGVYRVTVAITPRHLAAFLDDQAEALIHPYPWIYSNAFRLGL